jgi:hypothetical protein
MFNLKIIRVIGFVVLLAITGLAQSQALRPADDDNQTGTNQPIAVCDNIEPPSGSRIVAHAYAIGVQRYRWDGAAWVFAEPVATLYADASYYGKVGVHYAGPTWESNGGGKVVAARLQSCAPDATAIPWLLLQTTSTDGPGILSLVTHIQRVKTKGGLAPIAPGASIGVVAEVPYTAEYYFYRARN